MMEPVTANLASKILNFSLGLSVEWLPMRAHLEDISLLQEWQRLERMNVVGGHEV